jgi:hypothetical protein
MGGFFYGTPQNYLDCPCVHHTPKVDSTSSLERITRTIPPDDCTNGVKNVSNAIIFLATGSRAFTIEE